MRRDAWTALLLAVGSLVLYAAYNAALPITDPVESNYALTAKEMLTAGDWLSPRIYGQYWYDKPVLIYWLIMLSYKMWGVTEFAARLPGAVCGALSVAAAYWFGRRMYDARTGLYSALVLATSLEFWVVAHLVITDMALFLFSALSMACFYLAWHDADWRWATAAYALAGLAVLTKGPVGLVLPGITVIAFVIIAGRWRQWQRLYLWPGLAVFLLVAGPWYFFMYQAHGRDFVDVFLGVHNYLRATVAEHPKDNVIYYYLVLFPLSLLPWTGTFLQALWRRDFLRRDATLGLYLLVWLVAILVFYTAMATKYPTYVFPALFPAAIMMGCRLAAAKDRRRTWLWLVVPAVLWCIGVAAAALRLPQAGGRGAMVVALVSLAVVVLLLTLYWRGPRSVLPSYLTGGMVVLNLVLLAFLAVPLAHARSAKDISSYIPAAATVGSYGDYSTSAVFYSGAAIVRLEDRVENVSPTALSWGEKYTMPTESVTQFMARTENQGDVYIMAKLADQSKFRNLPGAARFTPVAARGGITLYRQQAPAAVVKGVNSLSRE